MVEVGGEPKIQFSLNHLVELGQKQPTRQRSNLDYKKLVH